MVRENRREFMAGVGRGMLLASIGTSLAFDLGISRAEDVDSKEPLNFGNYEPLVALMQETPVEKLLPILVDKIKNGTDLKTLTAAGALANARSFGGQDYTGYHALMALVPAYEMSLDLPAEQKALPVLKVLYRNSARIQENGGRKKEVLHAVKPTSLPAGKAPEVALRDATRSVDWKRAEQTFATMTKGPIGEAFNHLQFTLHDEVDVHRVVLAWRAWSLIDFTGSEFAHTLLRQSVRYCIDDEAHRKQRGRPDSPIRLLLPKLLDQYKLAGRTLGTRTLDDAGLEKLTRSIYAGNRAQGAEVAAAALADGLSPEVVGNALAIASNLLLLCDRGRKGAEPGKPIGSVHGASVGVHASDSAHAWRNIVRVSNSHNKVASLIVGAFHTAGQAGGLHDRPYPFTEHLEGIRETDPAKLLSECESAIKQNQQARACAIVHRYGELGHSPNPVFSLLLKYAVSEDGALHAEKYYRTVADEFVSLPATFKWRQLTALARVTASEYGNRAPGYQSARDLLQV